MKRIKDGDRGRLTDTGEPVRRELAFVVETASPPLDPKQVRALEREARRRHKRDMARDAGDSEQALAAMAHDSAYRMRALEVGRDVVAIVAAAVVIVIIALTLGPVFGASTEMASAVTTGLGIVLAGLVGRRVRQMFAAVHDDKREH